MLWLSSLLLHFIVDSVQRSQKLVMTTKSTGAIFPDNNLLSRKKENTASQL